MIPIDRILTETDGPFAKIRGRELMPWDVNNAVKTLSKILNKTEDKMGKIMEGNFMDLIY
ncbi:TatD family hydrolase [Photorhabdus viridis]|uniref:TatD family hydrolase n=1 Tax=Photorhabdus viridis TaxID=3163327 RepID=UPI003307450A